MFVTKAPLILASTSPRRKEFFEQAGLEFTVCSADIDETVMAGETPHQYVCRLAVEKAKAVGMKNQASWVVGADTVVVCDNIILGKPENEKHAEEMLLMLSDRGHQVLTSFCVVKMAGDIVVNRLVATDVFFDTISLETAKRYVATKEPLDKAGSYGIQGIGGLLVRRINGSYSNVVGLPMAELLGLLRELDIII